LVDNETEEVTIVLGFFVAVFIVLREAVLLEVKVIVLLIEHNQPI
jgi:hypothetical protein